MESESYNYNEARFRISKSAFFNNSLMHYELSKIIGNIMWAGFCCSYLHVPDAHFSVRSPVVSE